MPTHKSYQSYLVQSLENPAEVAAYLDAVLEDGDFGIFCWHSSMWLRRVER